MSIHDNSQGAHAWDAEHRGIGILRRNKSGAVEFYCVVDGKAGRRELVADSTGSLHARIDVELARDAEPQSQGDTLSAPD
jgi:hypothetical protein